LGKNDDGTVSKLSKRHGAVSFQDLLNDGYLPSAINKLHFIVGVVAKNQIKKFFQ